MNTLVSVKPSCNRRARPLAREAAERGDDGSNDLIVGQVVRLNELQSWFIGEHLQD